MASHEATAKTWVQSCSIYNQAKPDRRKSLSLLQPLPILDRDWKMVSMDIIDIVYLVPIPRTSSLWWLISPLNMPFHTTTSPLSTLSVLLTH
jgi:hypothetical protein